MKIACLVMLGLAANAPAQIIAGRIQDPAAKHRPTPRMADGHPDLGNGKGSWNPRVIANLSGMGRDGRGRSPTEGVVELPFQPWAKAEYERRQANLSKDDPEGLCLPPGIPRLLATPFPFQIFQVPDRVIFLFEGGTHAWRTIYTDGRPHPKDVNPTFLGDAIGHWEKDTLVVDVVGFNERTWLDQEGTPHSDALHVIERYTRVDEDTLRYQATIDDPKAYTKAWTTSFLIPWVAKAEPWEYICNENNMDLSHMVGK